MATERSTFGWPTIGAPEELTIHGSRIAIGVLTVGFAIAYLAGSVPSLQTQLLIYLVGMVALNLPHGGYEHFDNLRQRGLPFGGRYVATYLGFVAVFIALFFVAPVLALVFAFGTAVAKGGHGDLKVMDALVGTDHIRSKGHRAVAALARGGAIMIVPLLFWPETYYTFSSYMVNLFEPGGLAAVAGYTETVGLVLGGGYALVVLAHLGLGYATAGASTSFLIDAGETLLLVAYFAAVPVVVSIGLYFPLWYSLRQSGRTMKVKRERPRTEDGLAVPLAWGALIVGALATASLAALFYWLVPNPLGGASLLAGVVAFYTVFLCIIALPHVVVGEWLDRKRGIWYVP